MKASNYKEDSLLKTENSIAFFIGFRLVSNEIKSELIYS